VRRAQTRSPEQRQSFLDRLAQDDVAEDLEVPEGIGTGRQAGRGFLRHTHTQTHTQTKTHTHTQTHTHTHTHTHTTHTHTHTHTHRHMYMHMHIHMHAHTHAHTGLGRLSYEQHVDLAGVSEVSEDNSSRNPAKEGFNSALCSSPSTTNAASNFQGSTVDDSSATSSLFERCFQLMFAFLVFVYLRSFVDFQSLLYLFAS
jgi:thiol:disulfide interchange protein